MSRIISRRLLAQPPSSIFIEPAQAFRLPFRCRPFSATARSKAEGDEGTPSLAPNSSPDSQAPTRTNSPPDVLSSITRRTNNSQPVSPSLHPKAAASTSALSALGKFLNENQSSRAARRSSYDVFGASDGSLVPNQVEMAEAHHFHIYATRHNTHITVTRPDRSPLISVSAGNIGFRHAGRKHYDSAFQLASYVLGRMNESGMSAEIKRLEVILRGFGAGREAVTKALLGTEGRFLRPKVIKVADATRLKFGGTRSKKPRRLG